MKVSRITSKYQATVPSDVRAALGVGAGDQLAWDVDDAGAVKVRRLNGGANRHPHATVVDRVVAGEWLSEEDDGLVAGY